MYFVIWRLFNRSSSFKLRHLLCHGFERCGSAFRQKDEHYDVASSIPGLLARNPNSSVHTLIGPLWCRLKAILGEAGDRIMMDLLTESAIFSPVEGESANYYQLSGPPIFDLEPCKVLEAAPPDGHIASPRPSSLHADTRTLCKIAFVRSRMFYAKAALNAKGGVRFGMRHIRQSSSTCLCTWHD